MRKNSKSTSARRPPGGLPPVSDCTALVRIDSEPIRRRARQAYERAQLDLKKRQEEIESFTTGDRPLFERWVFSTFGAQLTELRELQQKIDDVQTRITELTMAAFQWKCTTWEAAERIQAGENPWASKERDPASEAEDDEDDDFFAFDYDELFGDEDDEMEDFAQFASRARQPRSAQQKKVAGERGARIKEIYRRIARSVHPDAIGKKMSASVQAIWFETQTAYRVGDLEKLELLLFRLNIETGHDAPQVQVSLLQRLTQDLRRAIRSLNNSLQQFRRDPAWNFSKLQDHTRVRRQIRTGLVEDLDNMQMELRLLSAELAACQRPPPQRRQPARRSRRQPYSEDLELPF